MIVDSEAPHGLVIASSKELLWGFVSRAVFVTCNLLLVMTKNISEIVEMYNIILIMITLYILF